MNYKNKMIIISGPSGVGEDTIIKRLGEMLPVERVVTDTTREMRRGESPANPYYFIPRQDFLDGIKNNHYFEYAEEYNGNLYGVSFQEIKRVKKSGKIGIWKLEYKGVITAKKLIPGIIAIFINAPLKDLERRIRSREGEVSDEYITERMEYTKEWLKYKDIYDYEVINEEGRLDEAVKKVADIIKTTLKIS